MLGNSLFGIGASVWTAMSSSKRAMVVSPAELSQAGRMPDAYRCGLLRQYFRSPAQLLRNCPGVCRCGLLRQYFRLP